MGEAVTTTVVVVAAVIVPFRAPNTSRESTPAATVALPNANGWCLFFASNSAAVAWNTGLEDAASASSSLWRSPTPAADAALLLFAFAMADFFVRLALRPFRLDIFDDVPVDRGFASLRDAAVVRPRTMLPRGDGDPTRGDVGGEVDECVATFVVFTCSSPLPPPPGATERRRDAILVAS